MLLKSKIFFVISTDEFARNYIHTDVLNKIENDYDVTYIINEKISVLNNIEGTKKIIKYDDDYSQNKKLINLFDVYMYKNINKSSSFYFRFKRYNLPKNIPFFKTIYYFLKNILDLKISFFEYYFKTDLIKIRASKFIFPFYSKKVLNNLNINEKISNAFKNTKPDLIIYPSSAYEPISFDLIELSKKFKCKTFFLIDNWDNLSSKTILIKRPDFLGVWSEQAKLHAIEIQNFPANKVKIIGSARFNNYFSSRKINLSPHFNFKYILFIGTALEFDEYEVLFELNSIINDNSKFSGFKIVYRPHPWRQSRNNRSVKSLINVIIDPQVEENYLNNNNTLDFQPDLKYYPSLISNADFLVGGLSSMLIESMIFNKKYIVMVHDDNKHFTNQKNALKYYTHFKGIENLENLYFCDNLKNLGNLINSLDEKDVVFSDVSFQCKVEFFIFGSEEVPYSTILLDSVREILND